MRHLPALSNPPHRSQPARVVAMLAFSLGCFAGSSAGMDLFVDPVNGDDGHDGMGERSPLQTIVKARDLIRTKKLNRDMKEDLVVHLRGGRYQLDDTLLFDARDSGSNGHRVIYRAAEGEQPVLCGGRMVTNWQRVEDKPYFVAQVPGRKAIPLKAPKDPDRAPALHPRFYTLQTLSDDGFADYFAQLYVNGVRAELARSHTPRSSSRTEWWDDPETPWFRDGIPVRRSDIKDYSNPQDLRILWLEWFKTADVPVAALLPGDSDEEAIIRLRQPDFYKASSWKRIQPKTEFFIVNALEELDEPGEWYLDQKRDLVFYYPFQRDGDLDQAEVYAPRVEGLVRIDGSPMEPAHHLRFEGVTFQHGNWSARKDHYLGLSQAEIFKTYTSEFPGQVILDHADDIEIVGCTLRHMASCGIQLYEGCNRVLIEGNLCHDTTGAGITVGRWWLDQRECPPASVCTDVIIRNNIVRNTGRDYWQATGINVFAAWQCKVHHNDVSDIAYTAIHARIGDNPFIHPRIGRIEYKANKVSRAFAGEKWGIGDGGHLYLHGRYPDSVVTENYSLYANRNVNMEYYPDNHSYKELWTRNVSRYSQAKRPFFIKGQVTVTGNFSDRPPDRRAQNHTLVENDEWPPEARSIMDRAGLQPPWRHRLVETYGHENLAQGKPCRASSELGDTNAAAAAVDGNPRTFWHTRPGGDGEGWWMVDLGAAYIIDKITILPRQDMFQEHARSHLEVQASNDPDFTRHVVLCERREVSWYHKGGDHCSNLWEQFIPTMDGHRYLRVKSTGKIGALNFAEFGAYGHPAPAKAR